MWRYFPARSLPGMLLAPGAAQRIALSIERGPLLQGSTISSAVLGARAQRTTAGRSPARAEPRLEDSGQGAHRRKDQARHAARPQQVGFTIEDEDTAKRAGKAVRRSDARASWEAQR